MRSRACIKTHLVLKGCIGKTDKGEPILQLTVSSILLSGFRLTYDAGSSAVEWGFKIPVRQVRLLSGIQTKGLNSKATIAKWLKRVTEKSPFRGFESHSKRGLVFLKITLMRHNWICGCVTARLN